MVKKLNLATTYLMALTVIGCSDRAPGEQADPSAQAASAEASEQAAAADASKPAGAATGAENAASPSTPTLDQYPFGTVQRSAIWRLANWTPSDKPIAVCWENPSNSDRAYRASVQEAVKATWETTSLLRFTGWGTCTNNKSKENIRIRITEEGPHVKALGRYLDDYPGGMVLNFSFANWSPDCQERRDFCARVIGVHEFGHALAFAHEQNRGDAPPQCRNEKQGTTGDWNITSYDPQSVMNYCNPKWNNDGSLSARDIAAVTTIYGRRT